MARKSVKDIEKQLARIQSLYQADRSIPNLARIYRAQDIAERYRTTMQANTKG